MKTLLTILLTLCVVFLPWRLIATGAELAAVTIGHTQWTTADDDYWRALGLQLRIESLGYSVTYAEDLQYGGQKAYGLTIPSMHQVFIDSSLHWNARYAVLAHEGGHILQPVWVDGEQGEVFAESVAILVTGGPLREHARYLAIRPFTFLTLSLMEWRAMYHAAAVLSDR
jgi:hypothetical protein